jgi:LCP family protein required for cell wall assembly
MSILVLGLTFGTSVGYLCVKSPVVRNMIHTRLSGDWKPESAFPGQSQVTVLLLGKDVDRDNHGNVVNTKGRTDSIMVARLDFTNKTANILSIPRDTRVRIPGHGRHRINAAHAYGGPELTAETIENFLDIKSDQYVVIDYESFEKALDVLGGLQIDVAKEMNYDDNWGNLHIHLQPGRQVLCGKDALGFVRYRKSNDGAADTDQDRIARQQQFIFAAKQKLLSTSTFFKLPEVFGTIRSGVNSSMTDAQLMCIAQFIKSLPPASVHTATLPSPSGVYVTADDSEAREQLVSKMFN